MNNPAPAHVAAIPNRLSVVMPVRNAMPYLDAAVESINKEG